AAPSASVDGCGVCGGMADAGMAAVVADIARTAVGMSVRVTRRAWERWRLLGTGLLVQSSGTRSRGAQGRKPRRRTGSGPSARLPPNRDLVVIQTLLYVRRVTYGAEVTAEL